MTRWFLGVALVAVATVALFLWFNPPSRSRPSSRPVDVPESTRSGNLQPSRAPVASAEVSTNPAVAALPVTGTPLIAVTTGTVSAANSAPASFHPPNPPDFFDPPP